MRYKKIAENDLSLLDSTQKIHSRAINSGRGAAAAAAITLANRLLKADQPLPELLVHLLEHFAHDEAIYARWPILIRLPFLLYKKPDFGWQLLGRIFQEPQSSLWKDIEKCLYSQYRENFLKVRPYLERLKLEGMTEAGDVWGRIITLASLAGHLSQEDLFHSLETANDKAWRGVAQVFTANIDRNEHTSICSEGLLTILNRNDLSDEVLHVIAHFFRQEDKRIFIKCSLALSFLRQASSIKARSHLDGFLEWLSYEASHNPISALGMTELLLDQLESQMVRQHIWHIEPLIAVLSTILREADETDDLELIQRSIDVQDRFLRLEIYGLEILLDQPG
jgi:hypothetical protein